MKVFAAIKKAVENARSALVASHVDPDGDSLGSILAVGLILEHFGVDAELYCEDGIPKLYRFLTGAEKIKRNLDSNRRFDLLIALDSSDICRLGKKIAPREIAKTIINIDHHPDNAYYGDINYVDKSSSTAELVYNFAKFLKMKISRALAENLYVALITDTGNFRYENTSVATFAMAADLIRAGVNTHQLTTKIYDNKSVAGIRVRAAALSGLEISPDRKAAWAVVSKEMMEKTGAKGEDLIGLVDQIRSVEGIEVAMLFKEDEGEVKVNFRSKEKVNVSEVAKRFGGGGHIRAAGAVIPGDMETVKQKVVAEVLKYLKAAQFLA